MDPALLEDRVFRNMMDTEDCYISDNNYFENVQKEIKPHMRKLVTDWMLEVDTAKIELSPLSTLLSTEVVVSDNQFGLFLWA